MTGRALEARDAWAKAASLRDAIRLWQRWELMSTYGRSMTFWPVTGRQRSARGRGFLADDLSTRSGQESIGRCAVAGGICRTQHRLSSTRTSALVARERRTDTDAASRLPTESPAVTCR